MSLIPASHFCVPDAYLTNERLNILFNEFNKCLSHAVPRAAIFANLVNNVRQLYVSEILVLQQDLVTRTTPHESESTSTQHDCQLAAQHDQLAAQHEREVKALKERHDQKLCEISREREVERAKWGKSIPTEWLVGIDVVYGDQPSQRPPNRIQELTGHGDDINSGCGGKFVWLVPRYDTDAVGALTGVDIAIQDNVNESKCSLSQGAGGKHRYLVPHHVKSADKIYSMNLLRLNHAIGGAPVGYDGSSVDINQGRDGWLYLIWKSQCVQVAEGIEVEPALIRC